MKHRGLFQYPVAVQAGASNYVPQRVKLEFGSRGETWPTANQAIRPYAAEAFPDVFETPTTTVVTLKAERTFWEKATILHVEAHRSKNKPLPARSSRHYYDLAMLTMHGTQANALADTTLLERVVQHKNDFFRCGWARYDEAKPGTFRLVPPEFRIKELQEDYERMKIMMFDQPPAFDVILERLTSLECEINRLPSKK